MLFLAMLLTARIAKAQDGAPTPPEHLRDLRVYVLTFGPGDEPWEKFGHNAIRFIDDNRTDEWHDVAFNWGMFSFDHGQIAFAWEFLQGRLIYSMGATRGQPTIDDYIKKENRTVLQQELNLTSRQKFELRDRLARINDDESLRTYRYDYYNNNCSSRVRDAVDDLANNQLSANTKGVPSGATFRWHTDRLTASAPWLYVLLQGGMGHPVDQPIDRELDVRGAILGLTRDTGINEIVSAGLQSVCYQSRDLQQSMALDGLRPDRLRVDGGMVANNWLMQFLADLLGVPVVRPKVTETTALGAAYRAQGKHEEAQKCLRRALKIHERTQGVQSAEAIQDLQYLAGSLEESGDLGGAAAQYERALLFEQRVIGGNIDELAELQMGMATLYVNWQNYSRARELLLECVATFKRKGGVRLAVGYETLGYVEECSGRYAEAVGELQLAAKVWETLMPERLPELLRCLGHRADLLELLRRKGDAERLRERIAILTPQLESEFAAAR